tara:strand:- start:1527 stop:3095 length:1569 start_codon:yes stop_codon:yes gene_type:complete
MDIHKIKLLFNTLRHLKPIQFYYRVYYFFKKFFIYNYKKPLKKKISFLKWYYNINSPKSLKNNNFRFLNINNNFDLEIDWNFDLYGKLWTYNLNYFDFLNQKVILKERGLELIHDYINKDNLLKDGKEPYPISLRGVNWIKFLSKNKINNKKINQTLFDHYQILYNNIEYHLLGNHILENAFSLFFASYFFNDRNFLLKSNKILKEELNEQINDDGSHFELSTMYHKIILHRVLDCIQLIKNNNFHLVLLGFLEKKAILMLSFLETIMFKDYTLPKLNDSCEGIAPNVKELFSLAKNLNLNWNKIQLSDSGYRKWNIDNFEIIMDIGSIGAKYISGHSHADTFNFVLNHRSMPLVVDLGVSTYEKCLIRDQERSTRFHNTLSIDVFNSSEIWSAFRVGNRAKVNSIYDSSNKIKFVHDGYKKTGFVHTREFQKSNNLFTITDYAENKSNYSLESNLHFHPDSNPIINNCEILLKDVKIKLIGYENPKLIEYNYPLGFNKYKKAFKLNSIVKNKSSIIFSEIK